MAIDKFVLSREERAKEVAQMLVTFAESVKSGNYDKEPWAEDIFIDALESVYEIEETNES